MGSLAALDDDDEEEEEEEKEEEEAGTTTSAASASASASTSAAVAVAVAVVAMGTLSSLPCAAASRRAKGPGRLPTTLLCSLMRLSFTPFSKMCVGV